MKKLSIPAHISLDKYYLPGIGRHEVKQLLFFTLPGLIAMVILWLAIANPGPKLISLICCMAYLLCCYVMVAKIDGSQSMYTYISRILRFRKSQKHFYFKKGKEVIYLVGEKKQP